MTTSTLARATDPLTSHIAAEPSATRYAQAEHLLSAFAGVKGGLTAEEAAEKVALTHTGYWKRISELLRAGYLQVDRFEVTRMGSSGRPQRVLHITARGEMHILGKA